MVARAVSSSVLPAGQASAVPKATWVLKPQRAASDCCEIFRRSSSSGLCPRYSSSRSCSEPWPRSCALAGNPKQPISQPMKAAVAGGSGSRTVVSNSAAASG